MKKDIRNYNNKGQLHDYVELYWDELGKQLLLRCNMKNGKNMGYEEWYGGKKTNFYIR